MPRYLTLGTLNMTPGMRAMAEGIADQGVAMVEQQPGFVSVTCFLDEERSVHDACTVWESKEAAEAGDKALTPAFAQAFGDTLQGGIKVERFEIYEPKRA
jgi:heme-degrading monooxygenase HmoA